MAMTTKKEVLEAALRGEGCLGKAADDEPVFVLRGQDAIAAAMVDYWAERARVHGCTPGKVLGARRIADAMRSYPGRKFPD